MTIRSDGPAVLDVEGLSVSYGAVRAVRGVSLALHEDECVGVVGANGAGKSSLLGGICGLVRPAGGAVRLAGESVTGARVEDNVRRGLVLVPERRQLFASMSVRDNLLLGSYAHARDRRVPEALERVEALFPILAERREQRAGTLSGGEQQMLAIARALMGRPRLLLLDEPSMGLAPMVVEMIFRIIAEIRGQGTTVFVVEQNAAQALRLADRGYVMENGRIVFDDTAANLLVDPRVRAVYLGEEVEEV